MSKPATKLTSESLLPSNNFSLIKGCLLTDEGQEVGYWPIEVSQFRLVVVTDHLLMMGDLLQLQNGQKKIGLTLTKCIANYHDSVFFLCCFDSLDRSQNIEQLLKHSPELRRWNAQALENEPIRLPSGQVFVRASRFTLLKPLHLTAKTFGSRSNYDLSIQNASKTGLLMVDGDDPAPFKVNTLLEINIDSAGDFFSQPLPCLAKVVRVNNLSGETNGRHSFAIRIIEIELSHQNTWSSYIEELERELAKERTP